MSQYLTLQKCQITFGCWISLKDCRVATVKTVLSVIPYLLHFYAFYRRYYGAQISQTTDESEKNDRRGSRQLQLLISITDRIAIDSEFALLLVLAWHNRSFGLRAVNHSNTGVAFKGRRSEVCSFIFHTTGGRLALKAAEEQEICFRLVTVLDFL